MFLQYTPMLRAGQLHGPLQSIHQLSRCTHNFSHPFPIHIGLKTGLHALISIHKLNISTHTCLSPDAPQTFKNILCIFPSDFKYCIFADYIDLISVINIHVIACNTETTISTLTVQCASVTVCNNPNLVYCI